MDKSFIIYIILCICLIIIVYLMLYRKHIIENNLTLTDGKEPLKYIPKQIFQMVQDKKKISEAFRQNIDYIKKLNPDWNYILLDDTDIDVYFDLYYPELKPIYKKINPKYGASRADFFRYILMYREGGVYLDIKSAMSYPLNNIIKPDDEYILAHWGCECQKDKIDNTLGEYQQWHIICKPNHPFLSNVIQHVVDNIKNYKVSDGVGKPGVLKITGPIAYSEAILPIKNMHNHRLAEMNEYIGLVYNNIHQNHKNLFSKAHYSKINEPIIITTL